MLYLVIGRRELGKTTLTRFLANKLPSRVLLDPRNMIAPQEGGEVVRDLAGIPPAFDRLYTGKVAEVIVKPRRNRQEAFNMVCEEVSNWIEADPLRQLSVVLDDMRFFKDQQGEALDDVLRNSKRSIVHVFMTCHRPVDLSVDIRAIADHLCLFHTNQRHDLDELRKLCGELTTKAVSELQPYEWVQWDAGKAKATLWLDKGGWFVALDTMEAPGVDTFAGLPGGTDAMSKGRLFG